MVGYNDGADATVSQCVAANNKIDVTYESEQVQQGGGYGQRILGGFKNNAPTPEMNNYALKTMMVSINDVPQKVYDDIMNGTAKTMEQLKTQSTYSELGWDFSSIWSMNSITGFPYLKVKGDLRIIPGDANGDGVVNATDIVEIVNYIAKTPTAQFLEQACDLNDDDDINVTDIVLIVSVIMNDGSIDVTPGDDTPKETTDNDFLTLTENGQTLSLNLNLNNQAQYVACQFDIQLSEGQILESVVTDKNRADSHYVFCTKMGNNLYKVIIYSLDNESFEGNNGAVADIYVKGDGRWTSNGMRAPSWWTSMATTTSASMPRALPIRVCWKWMMWKSQRTVCSTHPTR